MRLVVYGRDVSFVATGTGRRDEEADVAVAFHGLREIGSAMYHGRYNLWCLGRQESKKSVIHAF